MYFTLEQADLAWLTDTMSAQKVEPSSPSAAKRKAETSLAETTPPPKPTGWKSKLKRNAPPASRAAAVPTTHPARSTRGLLLLTANNNSAGLFFPELSSYEVTCHHKTAGTEAEWQDRGYQANFLSTMSWGHKKYPTKKACWFEDAASRLCYLNKEEAQEAWTLITSKANTDNKYGGFLFYGCEKFNIIIDNEDDPATEDEEPTMANLVAAFAECNITITGFEAITLKAKPDEAEITFEN